MRKFIKGWGLTIDSKDFPVEIRGGKKEQGNGRQSEDKEGGLREHRLHVTSAKSILRFPY